MSRAALEGLMLLDLGGVGPAGRCVRLIADLGARWIQLVAPAAAGRLAVPWHTYGAMRGVERLEVDLKRPEGKEVFLRLAAKADIIVEGFRPGVADRLGIGYEEVSQANPRAIYCATTGYGQKGPYASWAGHDVNYQAVSGGLATAGRDAVGKPALPGMTFADSAGGGWAAAIQILAALHVRSATGRGQYVDASAAHGMLQLNSVAVDEYLATGKSAEAGRGLLSGGYACYAIYRTSDDGFLSVGAIETKFFRTLCATLGLEHLAKDQYRIEAQDALREALAKAFLAKSRDQWMAIFESLDVCVAPVLSIEEVTRDKHWQATGMFVEYEHPDHGKKKQVSAFGQPGKDRGAAPAAEARTSEKTLRDFGYAQDEIEALKRAGAIG